MTLNESNRIGLAWTPSAAATVYKLVYQKTGASSFLTLSTTIIDDSFLVTGLQADSTYTFKYIQKPTDFLTFKGFMLEMESYLKASVQLSKLQLELQL